MKKIVMLTAFCIFTSVYAQEDNQPGLLERAKTNAETTVANSVLSCIRHPIITLKIAGGSFWLFWGGVLIVRSFPFQCSPGQIIKLAVGLPMAGTGVFLIKDGIKNIREQAIKPS